MLMPCLCGSYPAPHYTVSLRASQTDRHSLRRATAVHTPIAWGHINFAEEKLKDALGILPPRNQLLKTALKTEGRDRKNFRENQKYTRNVMVVFVPLF